MGASGFLALILTLMLLALVGCGGDGDARTTSPVPNVTLTAESSAPPPPSQHDLTAGEKQALRKAIDIVAHPGSAEEKEHLAGYTGEGALISGYLVQCTAPGFLLAYLADMETGRVLPAGGQYGWDPWAAKRPKCAGEEWAVTASDVALKPVLRQLRLDIGETEVAICGYVVAWPAEGIMTMWIDLEGSLRGGVGIP